MKAGMLRNIMGTLAEPTKADLAAHHNLAVDHGLVWVQAGLEPKRRVLADHTLPNSSRTCAREH